jgi:hypothetical protein
MAAEATRRTHQPQINEEEERMLREATLYLIRNHGGLFVATALRKEQTEGSTRWVITVTLRYPSGHEGYVADLLYDGHAFALLTDPSEIDERVRKIAAGRTPVHQENGR